MKKEIQKLKDHVIVCGYGRNGKQACDQLRSENVKFVAIEAILRSLIPSKRIATSYLLKVMLPAMRSYRKPDWKMQEL